jgi:hypothetical protein
VESTLILPKGSQRGRVPFHREARQRRGDLNAIGSTDVEIATLRSQWETGRGVWIASVQTIPSKFGRANEALETLHQLPREWSLSPGT